MIANIAGRQHKYATISGVKWVPTAAEAANKLLLSLFWHVHRPQLFAIEVPDNDSTASTKPAATTCANSINSFNSVKWFRYHDHYKITY